MRSVIRAALALALVGLVTTGCGASDMPNEQSTESRATTPADDLDAGSQGTDSALIPIDSDNVAMAGYDDSTRIMTVLFDSGGLYEYYDVPVSLWEAFVSAQPDPWSLVGYPQLVQGGYAYQEITP